MTILTQVHIRLTATPLVLTAITVVWIFCLYNATYWSIGFEVFHGHPLSMMGFMLAVYLLTVSAFSLFGFPWVVKPFLAFILVLSAVTSYYMDTLGVIIDREMVQNVVVTTFAESKHLITVGFVLHVLIYGMVPAIALLTVRVKRQRILWTAVAPVITCVVSFALAVGLLMADLKTYSSILRERKDLMNSFQPGAPLVGAIRYVELVTRTTNVTLTRIGDDATKGPSYPDDRKPVLTIVVAGETARAQNFGLNGYERDTNPRLATLPVVNFSDVNSCGTATAVSLPCMFSRFSRGDYSHEKSVSYENVLDVLTKAGFYVEWWDNNTGHKQIADRISHRSFSDAKTPEFCGNGECIDGIFLQEIADFAKTITQDTVLVLHQIGSHGPTYYLRYPEEFERFKPACRTAEFKNCSVDEITNAYDNTIAYTDEILAQTIEFLQRQHQLSTALIYVSDHGESLGEGGLYLHGAPYFMAPEQQTKVPMILWMSDGFKDRFGIDQGCLVAHSNKTLSHDNLFHSLLGMLDIHTTERNPRLDIFDTCKTHQRLAHK